MRRAFALPTVLLLAVAGTVIVAALLTGSTGSVLSVNRQLERYRAHHEARGLQEVIGSWVKTVSAENIEEFLGPDGHALDLETDDGLTISVYLSEAQGTAHLNPRGDGDVDRETGLEIIRRLASLVDPAVLHEYTRTTGPVAVSVRTASSQVLEAVIGAVVEGARASAIRTEILAARERGKIDRSELARIVSTSGANGEERTMLTKLLTAEPDYWQVEIEVRRDGRRVDSITATTQIRRSRGGGRSPMSEAAFQPLGPFLTWERRPPE